MIERACMQQLQQLDMQRSITTNAPSLQCLRPRLPFCTAASTLCAWLLQVPTPVSGLADVAACVQAARLWLLPDTLTPHLRPPTGSQPHPRANAGANTCYAGEHLHERLNACALLALDTMT